VRRGQWQRAGAGLAACAVSAWVLLATALSDVPPEDPAAEIDRPRPAPRLAPEDDLAAGTRAANNPGGPRTIPHRVRGQQLDIHYNRCLACHGVDAPAAIRATPVPLTHRLDRDGERHEQLAGGRYVCTICHVPQHHVAERP
jgi:nitrate reductase cytochrome c-type subunit